MKSFLKEIYYQFLKIKNRLFVGGPVIVLMYHRVSNSSTKNLKYLTVTLDNFEKQLKYFKTHFRILDVFDDWKLPFFRKGIVVTFDDGYLDNFANALPILEKYNIPATLFVSTMNIDTNDYFWWDRLSFYYDQLTDNFVDPSSKEIAVKPPYKNINQTLTKLNNSEKNKFLNKLRDCNKLLEISNPEYRTITSKELKKLANHPLVNIGGHTENHYPLSSLSYKEQEQEILVANNKLKNITGKNIKTFAFPHGDYNADTLDILNTNNVDLFFLANDYYTNHKFKMRKKISRILINDISGDKLIKRLKRFS